MSLTLFGIIIVLVGALLLVRSGMAAMLAFVMVATLFGGSAAIALPALGGSTIPPANLALLFLILRAILPGPQQMERLGPALRANAFLIIFALYGIISAFIMPRLFAGTIAVTPLRPGAVRQLYEASPLHFSSQNITTAVYLMGTLIAGLGATIGAARPGSAPVIVRTGIIIAIAHAVLGFISILVAGTALDSIVEFFRNGNYAQLDQSIGGLNRMNGIWPEASGFAAYGGAWMIFMTELWLRDIERRRTGFAALLLALALLISTSSTAISIGSATPSTSSTRSSSRSITSSSTASPPTSPSSRPRRRTSARSSSTSEPAPPISSSAGKVSSDTPASSPSAATTSPTTSPSA